MSIYGMAKGTDFEALAHQLMQAEANGAMMYHALARMAEEQGCADIAPMFREAAEQEAVHAGFYATLAGKYPQDFWGIVRALAKAETKGEATLMAVADKMRAAGLSDAAALVERFAKQEGHHGVMMREILAKYRQEAAPAPAGKVFVCPVCGYEYEGDINEAPEDYVCPICGQPKRAFQASNR